MSDVDLGGVETLIAYSANDFSTGEKRSMGDQEYAPIAGDSRVLYHCLGCGSLVVSTARHEKWHREVADHTHHTLSRIGHP